MLLLGGGANALSVARSLARRGVHVAVAAKAGSAALDSRYPARRFAIAKGEPIDQGWLGLLTSRADTLEGSLLLACDDDAVGFLATHRAELDAQYYFDDSIPSIQLAMLDKHETLELAEKAGADFPRYWEAAGPEDADALDGKIQFPVLVKPLHSHLFQRHFTRGSRKYLLARDMSELRRHLQTMADLDLEAMIVEKVPGPDTLLASYYTYLDRDGEPLYHYTKKVLRRYPENEGPGSYHQTAWDEEVAEAGLRFFRGIGFRGFGNVEFKRDQRDGKLKIIECNPRFTAAQELLVRSGLDVAVILYDHLTGQPLPPMDRCREDIRLWHPVRDFRAYLELRKKRELSFTGWLASVCHRQAFPFFRIDDPKPSLLRGFRKLGGAGS